MSTGCRGTERLRGQDVKEVEQYHAGTCPGDNKDAISQVQGGGRAVAKRGQQAEQTCNAYVIDVPCCDVMD